MGAGAAVALVITLACAPAPIATAAPLPPDLVALEQQMAQLQINSERFSLQEELSLNEFLGQQGIPFVLIVAGEGEASVSPPQAAAVSSLLGLTEVQTRIIGNVVFTYERRAAAIDGGRPWVRSQLAHKEEGLDTSGMLPGDAGGPQGTFSHLIELLNGAQAIEEAGPVTVDDQRVIEFDATLDPTQFFSKLEPQSHESGHPLNSLFEEPATKKTPAKPSPPPTVKLELFIAPNGLPVRDRIAVTAEHATVVLRVDTLAINIPVHVSPPPAAQTIGKTQLTRIERRLAARELRRALRTCRRLHSKRASLCRALAHIRSRSPSESSESSLL